MGFIINLDKELELRLNIKLAKLSYERGKNVTKHTYVAEAIKEKLDRDDNNRNKIKKGLLNKLKKDKRKIKEMPPFYNEAPND